jgi:hypothetical protein
MLNEIKKTQIICNLYNGCKYDMGISEHDLCRDVDVRGVEVVDECRSYLIRVRYVRGLRE